MLVKCFKLILWIGVVAMLLPTMMVSCVKETQFMESQHVTLKFSVDTLSFDTVFTTMGTTTRRFKVYNPHEMPVRINQVTLGKGNMSRFRLNVDGDTSMVVKDLELYPHDSLFIFVQATINPNTTTEPFLVEDDVMFVVGEKIQRVALQAYGRNAIYHKPDPLKGYSIIDCEHWNHDMPHVVMGIAVVDSAETLSLQAGDELYFANDGLLWVYKGTLKVHGSQEKPVKFTSIRHDGWYDTLPGQWNYVWLNSDSKNNEIEYALVENGYVGFRVDSAATMTIKNSVVRNESLAGILGQGASINGDNVLVHTCQTATLALQHGGSYEFRNSTFANYWRYDSRPSPSVVLNNVWEYNHVTYTYPLSKAYFYNCIIYGSYSLDDGGEVLVYCADDVEHNIKMDHCLVKMSDISAVDTMAVVLNEDPLFKNNVCDYHLKATSPAVQKGSASWVTIPTDLDGNVRKVPPTLGAYEITE